MKRHQCLLNCTLSLLCLSCGSESVSVESESGAATGEDTRDATPDLLVELASDRVTGDITWTATRGTNTHIYSLALESGVQLRLTEDSAPWSFHAVGPQRRYVAAVAHEESASNGQPNLESKGTVWILDIKNQEAFPISPEGCNAGIGGVDWASDDRLLFAMSCAGEPSIAYRAPIDNRMRAMENLLAISAHNGHSVTQVSSALGSSIYSYVLTGQACNAEVCHDGPEIWVADAEAQIGLQETDQPGSRCTLTRSPALAEDNLLFPFRGDMAPKFTRDLSSMVFSRATASLEAEGVGGRDAFRIGIDLPRLLRGDSGQCDIPGSLMNLAGNMYRDDYASGSAESNYGEEHFPQINAYDASGAEHLLFVGRAAGRSQVYVVGPDEQDPRVQTDPLDFVVYARWIQQEATFDGQR